MNTVTCPVCESSFTQRNNYQKYCSRPCRRKVYQRDGGRESTRSQYIYITGNWERYFNRLCLRSLKRAEISKFDCVELLKKQNYKCALTGIEMTCILQRGVKTKTNASIDRINPKGLYTLENIQLVCAAVNKFRIDTPLDEFVDWCRKVANHAIH